MLHVWFENKKQNYAYSIGNEVFSHHHRNTASPYRCLEVILTSTQASSQGPFIIVTDSLEALSAITDFIFITAKSQTFRFSRLLSPPPHPTRFMFCWVLRQIGTTSNERIDCCQTSLSPSQNQSKATSNKIWHYDSSHLSIHSPHLGHQMAKPLPN